MFRLMSNSDIMLLLSRLEFLYADPKSILLGDCQYRNKISLFTFDPLSSFDGNAEFSLLGLNDYKSIMDTVFQSADQSVSINEVDLMELRRQMFRIGFY